MIRLLMLVALAVVASGCTDTTAPRVRPPLCVFSVAGPNVVVDASLIHDGVLSCRVTP